jgi:hypothetical protein
MTHLPNELALKMDGAQACYRCPAPGAVVVGVWWVGLIALPSFPSFLPGSRRAWRLWRSLNREIE